MNNSDLKEEWCLLQNQFDSYEKHSLYIKLVSILLVFWAVVFSVSGLLVFILLLVLWLQDAIWKTFQSRIETRLLQLEVAMSEGEDVQGFQFNSEYQKTSLSGLSLVKEYVNQAIRPTIAYPHCVLLFVFFLAVVFS